MKKYLVLFFVAMLAPVSITGIIGCSNPGHKGKMKIQAFRTYYKYDKIASIWVDTTDIACKPFGFRHGERVVVPWTFGLITATILGVGPCGEKNSPHKVLWYAHDDKPDMARYWSCDGYTLREDGFRLLKK